MANIIYRTKGYVVEFEIDEPISFSKSERFQGMYKMLKSLGKTEIISPKLAQALEDAGLLDQFLFDLERFSNGDCDCFYIINDEHQRKRVIDLESDEKFEVYAQNKFGYVLRNEDGPQAFVDKDMFRKCFAVLQK